MHHSKEDYLKAIWHLGGRKERVASKALIGRLGVQAPSVTDMLGRLAKEELIEYEPYKGCILTEKGREACLNLVRSHEIWEVFLVRHLGYRLAEAHAEADLLEHATSERLMERLDHFLDYPVTCPHGARVPRPGATKDARKLLPLSDVPAGDCAQVCRIEEEAELLDYLERCGLSLEDKIQVLAQSDFGGPLHLKVSNANRKTARELHLSQRAAEMIFVETIKGAR